MNIFAAPKRTAWLVLWALALPSVASAQTHTIHELLEAASRHPEVEVSELAAQEGDLRAEQANAALYPKLTLFGKAETYNSPTNLRPMPPTEVNVAAGDALPFSREIVRYGLALEAPLYVAKVYLLREKMRFLAEKSAIAHQVNLISRQAAVIALASGYQSLSQLQAAVDARLKSLDKTRDTIRLKVTNGRAPEAELMKIDNSLIALKQLQNDLALKCLDMQRDLEKFTGLEVTHPVGMELTDAPKDGEFIGLKLEEAELKAQKKEVERARAGRYPTLSLYGSVSINDGEAYNTDTGISRAYNFAGLVVNVPLFDRTLSAEEALSRVGERKAAKKLAATRIELMAQEKNLKARLPVVEAGLALARRSQANNRQLLNIAQVSYASGRTTTEEYLRYEAQFLDSQAAMAKAQDEQWQIRAKQAVLYGVDLRGVVQ
jgi:outer membrane protein TolC